MIIEISELVMLNTHPNDDDHTVVAAWFIPLFGPPVSLRIVLAGSALANGPAAFDQQGALHLVATGF